MIQLEVGKFYRSSSGYKAKVIGECDGSLSPRMGGLVVVQMGDCIHRFDRRGMPLDSKIQHLVAEWVDPPTPLQVLKDIRECLDGNRERGFIRIEIGSIFDEKIAAAIEAASK